MSAHRLRALNPYVTVDKWTQFDFAAPVFSAEAMTPLKEFSVVVVTDFIAKENLVVLDDFCRANKIGFILALS